MKYKVHLIKTDKFKTNLIAVMLTTELNRQNVTKNALIPTVLRRGTQNLKTQELISEKMEELYGASFDCGLDKTGDNQVLKFYIESLNDNYLTKNDENIINESLNTIFDIVFNPYLENGVFKEKYVEQEKENLKQIIEGKIDNKARYALDRCIEEMYKDKPFGLYKYGYIEDLKNIDAKALYEYYINLIENCKIDIFVSGNVDDDIEKIIENNENILKLKDREAKYNIPQIEGKISKIENVVQESMNVTQGKLILGLDLDISDDNLRYSAMLYNELLGGTANSKLFQNVREKASLAYTASSTYYRYKNNIFINCGIEIANYEQTLKIIKEQIEDMKNGKFTDDEINNAKKGIIGAIKTIKEEQDTEIMYMFGQEISNKPSSIEEYIKNIESVNRENIIDIANKISLNTIYFLKN